MEKSVYIRDPGWCGSSDGESYSKHKCRIPSPKSFGSGWVWYWPVVPQRAVLELLQFLVLNQSRMQKHIPCSLRCLMMPVVSAFIERFWVYKHDVFWYFLTVSHVVLCLSFALFCFLKSNFLCFVAFPSDLCPLALLSTQDSLLNRSFLKGVADFRIFELLTVLYFGSVFTSLGCICIHLIVFLVSIFWEKLKNKNLCSLSALTLLWLKAKCKMPILAHQRFFLGPNCFLLINPFLDTMDVMVSGLFISD